MRASRSSSSSRPPGPPSAFQLADDGGDLQHRLLAVAEHRGVDEVGDRLRVEGGVPAGQHDRVVLGAVARVQRDAGQVERGEHVGVAELGGERDAEQVERPHRPVRVDRELRHAVLAHQPLEVGPDRVGALGQHVGLLVEHLVQDLHALVGQADLVRVRVHQHPAHGGRVPVLDHRAQLAAHVLDRLAHLRQQALELVGNTDVTVIGPPWSTIQGTRVDASPRRPYVLRAVMAAPMAASASPLAARLAAWRYAFLTTNPPEQGVVDGVTRWLVVTRAGVLPMTLTSGLIAVLLAAIAPATSRSTGST